MQEIKTSCGCGAAGVSIRVAPRVRFRCHCSKCQSVYRAAYADALMFRRGQVKPLDPAKLKWIRTKSPSPLVRGVCRACEAPVVAHLFGGVSIVPAATLPDASSGAGASIALPEVACDIYYDTRVQDLSDAAPKYEGALAAYVGLTPSVTKVLALPGRALSAA
ncbi:GFA family protein [Shimia sp. R9_1]|uniref:GFA family protein n=1 Tax=Shimia sp. R9_1 TaxID=2821111 RepID=UPI001ADCC8CB|nr:GFA family protein [Shimia sp. R9_1]MBO9408652.1 GFA family protein [Shimia sp. R9_1]